MHMVINIPEEFKEIIDGENYLSIFHSVEGKAMLIYIIRNGIPLPKGHGRLKDIDKIISDGISKGFCNWYDEMKYAPTIIEADTESEA